MATFMSDLLGCKAIDDKAVKPIEEGLSEKYGKKFKVASLGDRIGRDEATAYVYASNDPTMMFVVRVSKDGRIVFENYAYRLVCREVEKTVNSAFSKNGLTAECYADFSSCKLDISAENTVNDYIKESGADTVKSAIIVKKDNKINGEILKRIYTEIHSQISEITVGFSLFVLSEKDYNNICEKVKTETQYFGLSRLRLYGAKDNIKHFYAEISNGALSVTADENNNKPLKGGNVNGDKRKRSACCNPNCICRSRRGFL
ncbi:MAG: hypothetical protein HDT47_01685 [Ruminococcaceae bacterium]|nr:hypothetical protein [Oscillospiraceae bacterium]